MSEEIVTHFPKGKLAEYCPACRIACVGYSRMEKRFALVCPECGGIYSHIYLSAFWIGYNRPLQTLK